MGSAGSDCVGRFPAGEVICAGVLRVHQQNIPFLHPEHQFVVGRDSGRIGTHLVSSKGFHTHPVNL